jgi:hypothetical protein
MKNIPGFSEDSLSKVSSLLAHVELNWGKQFETGRTGPQFPRENKTTKAPSLQTLDIDNRPGKQKGNQGKHSDLETQAIFPVTLPKGNPQPGPRSRNDLKGYAMFEEANCPKPKDRSLQPQKPLSEQPQNQTQGVTPPQPQQPPKPKDPAKEAERQRKKMACAQRQGAGPGVTFEEACKPSPRPRSPEQRQATQQATQASQQQGTSFDTMPKPQVQELGRQGGETKRAPQKPVCPTK